MSTQLHSFSLKNNTIEPSLELNTMNNLSQDQMQELLQDQQMILDIVPQSVQDRLNGIYPSKEEIIQRTNNTFPCPSQGTQDFSTFINPYPRTALFDEILNLFRKSDPNMQDEKLSIIDDLYTADPEVILLKDPMSNEFHKTFSDLSQTTEVSNLSIGPCQVVKPTYTDSCAQATTCSREQFSQFSTQSQEVFVQTHKVSSRDNAVQYFCDPIHQSSQASVDTDEVSTQVKKQSYKESFTQVLDDSKHQSTQVSSDFNEACTQMEETDYGEQDDNILETETIRSQHTYVNDAPEPYTVRSNGSHSSATGDFYNEGGESSEENNNRRKNKKRLHKNQVVNNINIICSECKNPATVEMKAVLHKNQKYYVSPVITSQNPFSIFVSSKIATNYKSSKDRASLTDQVKNLQKQNQVLQDQNQSLSSSINHNCSVESSEHTDLKSGDTSLFSKQEATSKVLPAPKSQYLMKKDDSQKTQFSKPATKEQARQPSKKRQPSPAKHQQKFSQIYDDVQPTSKKTLVAPSKPQPLIPMKKEIPVAQTTLQKSVAFQKKKLQEEDFKDQISSIPKKQPTQQVVMQKALQSRLMFAALNNVSDPVELEKLYISQPGYSKNADMSQKAHEYKEYCAKKGITLPENTQVLLQKTQQRLLDEQVPQKSRKIVKDTSPDETQYTITKVKHRLGQDLFEPEYSYGEETDPDFNLQVMQQEPYTPRPKTIILKESRPHLRETMVEIPIEYPVSKPILDQTQPSRKVGLVSTKPLVQQFQKKGIPPPTDIFENLVYAPQQHEDYGFTFQADRFSSSAMLGNQDVVSQLQSQSGKTVAFSAPSRTFASSKVVPDMFAQLVDAPVQAPVVKGIFTDAVFHDSVDHRSMYEAVKNFDHSMGSTYFFPTVAIADDQPTEAFKGVIYKMKHLYKEFQDVERYTISHHINETYNMEVYFVVQGRYVDDNFKYAASLYLGRMGNKNTVHIFMIGQPQIPDTPIEGLSFLTALYALAAGAPNDIVYTGTVGLMSADFVATEEIPPHVIAFKYKAYNRRMVVLTKSNWDTIGTLNEVSSQTGLKVMKGISLFLGVKNFIFGDQPGTNAYNIIYTPTLAFALMLVIKGGTSPLQENDTVQMSQNVQKFIRDCSLVFKGDHGDIPLMEIVSAADVQALKKRFASVFTAGTATTNRAVTAKSRLVNALENHNSPDAEKIYAITALTEFVPVTNCSLISPGVPIPIGLLLDVEAEMPYVLFKAYSSAVVTLLSQTAQQLSKNATRLAALNLKIEDVDQQLVAESIKKEIESLKPPQIHLSTTKSVPMTPKNLAAAIHDATVTMDQARSVVNPMDISLSLVQAQAVECVQKILAENETKLTKLIDNILNKRETTKVSGEVKDFQTLKKAVTQIADRYTGVAYDEIQEAKNNTQAQKNVSKLRPGEWAASQYISAGRRGAFNAKIASAQGKAKASMQLLDLHAKVGPNTSKIQRYAEDLFRKSLIGKGSRGEQVLRVSKFFDICPAQMLKLFKVLKVSFTTKGALNSFKNLDPNKWLDYCDAKLKQINDVTPRITDAQVDSMEKAARDFQLLSDLTEEQFELPIKHPGLDNRIIRESQDYHIIFSEDGHFVDNPYYISILEDETLPAVAQLRHIHDYILSKQGRDVDFLGFDDNENKYCAPC